MRFYGALPEIGIFVLGGVIYPRKVAGFDAFNACAATTAMNISAFIARPCFFDGHDKAGCFAGDFGFVGFQKRGVEFYG